MTNGKINIIKNGQYAVIQNAGVGIKGGHMATMTFLEAHRHLFDKVAFGRGYAELAIKADRLGKFIRYCQSNGFEVAGA